MSAAATTSQQPLTQITPNQVASFAYDPVDARALVDARTIVDDVRANGIDALRQHAVRLGDIAALDQPVLISKQELHEAYLKLPATEQQVLERTVQRIKLFAQAQRASIQNFQQKIEGGFAGQDVSPMNAAGCYAPGGRVRAASIQCSLSGVSVGISNMFNLCVCVCITVPIAVVGAHDGRDGARGWR